MCGNRGVCKEGKVCILGRRELQQTVPGDQGILRALSGLAEEHAAAFYRSFSAPLIEASVNQEDVYGSMRSKA